VLARHELNMGVMEMGRIRHFSIQYANRIALADIIQFPAVKALCNAAALPRIVMTRKLRAAA
jgi:hypothetical protein